MVGSGILLGALAAVASGRVAADVLRLIDTTDPVTYGSVAVLVLGAAIAAAWLPASSLTRIDPAETL